MGRIRGEIVIDRERCKGCGVCTQACPFTLISLSKDVNAKGYNFSVMTSEECTGCAGCAVVCPDSCITVFRSTEKK